MQLHELTTLSMKPEAISDALTALEIYTSDGTRGRLLGCWETEHGADGGDLLLLREFDDAQQLAEERQRVLTTGDPFGVGAHLERFQIETFAPFPYLPPIQTGHFGGVYEFHTYHLRIGGLTPTMSEWHDALPRRTRMYPLTTAMFALDGAPRIAHVWPYPDLNARQEIRGDALARGIWPPRHDPENITSATSTIAYPTAISPLC